jgi:hypothetical protein
MESVNMKSLRILGEIFGAHQSNHRALFFPYLFCIFFLLSTIKNILDFQWNLCKYEIIVDFRRHFWGTPVQSAGAASLRPETILQVLL